MRGNLSRVSRATGTNAPLVRARRLRRMHTRIVRTVDEKAPDHRAPSCRLHFAEHSPCEGP
jgi:hypothetical protein